jgi:hypothetical protein
MTKATAARRAAQRAIGTPDASELAEILGGFQRSLDELTTRISQLEETLGETGVETQAQLDLLRSVAVEHADRLDRLSSAEHPPRDTTDR